LISGTYRATYSAAADQAYRIQHVIAQDLATYLSIPLTMDDRRRLAQDPDGSHLAYDYAAIDELKDVLARHPRPDEAHRELARSYERVGNLVEAEKAIRLGEPAEVIRQEDEFRAMHTRPDFIALVGNAD
jgi:hypothetical protein